VQEARLFAESIVTTVREPLLVLDAGLRVVSANHAFYRTFQVAPEETAGRFVYELGDRQWDIPELRRLLEEILPQNTQFNDYEVRHNFEHIGERIMLLNARRIYREANKTHLILLAIEDITERKRAEEALQKSLEDLKRSNADLEQFAYVASHDLQEPLRMVSSYTQLIERRYKDKLDQDANDFINFAVDGANRMQLLINDLLDYSRVTTSGKEFSMVDLFGVLGNAVANLHNKIFELHAIVSNDNLPIVLGDETQLTRVFQNLIDNALKFKGSDHPRIHIGCKMDFDKATISVSDNGIGIDEQFQERVFTIFQKLHDKEKYPGTGIGLSICKRIIERHGGRIWFQSKENCGTTFYFTLKI